MSYKTTIDNFEIITYEPLSDQRGSIFGSAVLQGIVAVREALRKTQEASSILQQTNNDWSVLPSDFVLHVKTLLRCDSDGLAQHALRNAGRALNVLLNGMTSRELKFIEWGMDPVSNALDTVTTALNKVLPSVPKLFQPSDRAMVRGVSSAGMHLGDEAFAGCLNTGRASGNPNALMIKMAAIDAGVKEFTDTVVHESTHKFLGTVDTGMNGSGLNFLADDGLVNYTTQFPGIPLPIDTPGFRAMGPTEALGNAYILTGYILYMPKSEPYEWFTIQQRANNGPLGRNSPLGGALRTALASRRKAIAGDSAA